MENQVKLNVKKKFLKIKINLFSKKKKEENKQNYFILHL
jgi:hypothetical protein